MNDKIICANCGFEGVVERGNETCPECKKTGCLAWASEEQETTEPISTSSDKFKLITVLAEVTDFLEESHNEAVNSEYSDSEDPMAAHKAIEPECSYCRAIASASKILNAKGE